MSFSLNSNLTDAGKITGYEVREGDGVYITYLDGADTVVKKLGSLPDIAMTYAVADGGGMNPRFSVSELGEYNRMDVTCSYSGYSTCYINAYKQDGTSITLANKSNKLSIDITPYTSFLASVWGSGGSSSMNIRLYSV